MAPRRLWLVRAKVRGVSRLERWLADDEIAIGWREVGNVGPSVTREELRDRLTSAYPDRSAGTVAAWTGNVHRFVVQMSPGDWVVVPDGRRLYLARIRGDVRFAARHEEAFRRTVDWEQPEAPLDRHELSTPARRSLTTLLTVADLSHHADELLD